jgi:hypothetical protein
MKLGGFIIFLLKQIAQKGICILKALLVIVIPCCREAAVKLASDKQKSCTKRTTNLSGPLALPTRASANSLSAPIRSSGGRKQPVLFWMHMINSSHVLILLT